MSQKSVRFSQHALDKFELLAAHGFITTEEAVIQTVLSPDQVDNSKYPPIAERQISANTILRVVFIQDETGYLVITFYPGERTRYEN
jgi:hypothetical protein